MLKQIIWAVIAVFFTLSVLDFIIHEILLQSIYQSTAHLWRPEEEMKMLLMSVVTLVFSFCFVIIYSLLIAPKSMSEGIKYGCFLGLATGMSMGVGSYSYMPIPFVLAMSWFIGTLVELTIAGTLVGLMVKKSSGMKEG